MSKLAPLGKHSVEKNLMHEEMYMACNILHNDYVAQVIYKLF